MKEYYTVAIRGTENRMLRRAVNSRDFTMLSNLRTWLQLKQERETEKAALSGEGKSGKT